MHETMIADARMLRWMWFCAVSCPVDDDEAFGDPDVGPDNDRCPLPPLPPRPSAMVGIDSAHTGIPFPSRIRLMSCTLLWASHWYEMKTRGSTTLLTVLQVESVDNGEHLQVYSLAVIHTFHILRV